MAMSEGVLAWIRANPWPAVGWTTAVFVAWVVGGFDSFAPASEMAVVAISLGLFGVAIFAPPPRKPAPRRVSLIGWLAWLVPILTFSVLEIVNSLVFGSTPTHPTLSGLMDPVLESQPVRAAAVLLWLAAGRELLRR
ncbi:MAG TPA: hypothetical protein VLJ59_14730 [Mycobacteriales bacterium]|nr:hypothetical protein [Mycobacteriales bacterium]